LMGLAALLPAALHFAWQILSLQVSNGDDALAKFRSNRFAGVLVALACAVIGSTA